MLYLEKLCLSEDCINFFISKINEINKKLIAPEGKLLKLAIDAGLDRKEFIKFYENNELNPYWSSKQSKLSNDVSSHPWKNTTPLNEY